MGSTGNETVFQPRRGEVYPCPELLPFRTHPLPFMGPEQKNFGTGAQVAPNGATSILDFGVRVFGL